MRDKERRRILAESLGIEPDYERSTLKFKKLENWVMSFAMFLITLAIIIVLRLNFSIVKVDGASMDPTLHSGQILLIKKEKVNRFDIAVLTERLEDGGESKKIVKRVIGLPNDHVTVIDGVLYINNSKYEESYLDEANIQNFKRVNFDIIVPEGHVFVLGDNRDVSKDSRAVGCFKESSIKGVKIL